MAPDGPLAGIARERAGGGRGTRCRAETQGDTIFDLHPDIARTPAGRIRDLVPD